MEDTRDGASPSYPEPATTEAMETSIVEGETQENSNSKRKILGYCVAVAFTIFPIVQIAIGADYVHYCPIAPGIPMYLLSCGIASLLIVALFVVPGYLRPSLMDHVIWSVCVFGLILFYLVWLIYGSYLIYSMFPPKYTTTIRIRSISAAEPFNMTNVYFENQNQNQNQSHPFFNQTGNIQDNNTVMNLNQTLSLRNNSETNKEYINTPRAAPLRTKVLLCDRTLYLFSFWTTTLLYVMILILVILNELMK